MNRALLTLVAMAGLLGCQTAPQPTPPLAEYPIGLEELYRPDLLPRFKHSRKVGSFSSYDRTGGNDDGFSGKYSFLRKENGGLVLAELEGPGVIYRIWTPTPSDDPLEFYFDGESTPRIRINFRDLFTGVQDPFVFPIVGYGGGGFYCYLPIPFQKSLKVVARAEIIRFHQINYALYPAGSAIETYSGYESAAEREQLEKAKQFFSSAGSDISAHVAPPDAELQTHLVQTSLQPGQTVTLFETSRPGRIVGMRLRLGQDFRDPERSVVLRFYWDGDQQPAVLSPVGDFFGYAWGKPATRSLFLGTSGETNYVYLPMPYDRSARIELESQRTAGPPLAVEAEVLHSDLPRAEDEAKFYAFWRRENPTKLGTPFTFIETKGRGHVVGAILQAQGFESGSTPFFEGDDQATIDGELVVHGTGSEDFFNGGWYNVIGRWMSPLSFPLSGCLDYDNALARTGGYRFLLTDSYPFRKNVFLTIEHGPTENSVSTDYTAITYLYSEKRPTVLFELPPLEARGVSHLDRLVFRPGWSLPVEGFSYQNMTLAKKQTKVGDEQIRYLSARTEGEDIFGPHFIQFRCPLPAAGKYRVSIEALQGPDQATVELYRNERAEGEAADLYAPSRRKSDPVPLAVLDMQAGNNNLLLKLVGKNPRSSGLGLDLVSLILEKASTEP